MSQCFDAKSSALRNALQESQGTSRVHTPKLKKS